MMRKRILGYFEFAGWFLLFVIVPLWITVVAVKASHSFGEKKTFFYDVYLPSPFILDIPVSYASFSRGVQPLSMDELRQKKSLFDIWVILEKRRDGIRLVYLGFEKEKRLRSAIFTAEEFFANPETEYGFYKFFFYGNTPLDRFFTEDGRLAITGKWESGMLLTWVWVLGWAVAFFFWIRIAREIAEFYRSAKRRRCRAAA